MSYSRSITRKGHKTGKKPFIEEDPGVSKKLERRVAREDRLLHAVEWTIDATAKVVPDGAPDISAHPDPVENDRDPPSGPPELDAIPTVDTGETHRTYSSGARKFEDDLVVPPKDPIVKGSPGMRSHEISSSYWPKYAYMREMSDYGIYLSHEEWVKYFDEVDAKFRYYQQSGNGQSTNQTRGTGRTAATVSSASTKPPKTKERPPSSKRPAKIAEDTATSEQDRQAQAEQEAAAYGGTSLALSQVAAPEDSISRLSLSDTVSSRLYGGYPDTEEGRLARAREILSASGSASQGTDLFGNLQPSYYTGATARYIALKGEHSRRHR